MTTLAQHCTFTTLSSRGRRPALIPHHTDLSTSLFAVKATLNIAAYSPGLHTTDGVWILPPPPPSPRLEPIEVAEMCGEEFKRDVFTWVNTPTTDNERPALKVEIPPSAVDIVSAPTSPTTGGAEAVERQKRRLEEAAK